MNKFLKYKPSGVEWIGEIPVHWKISRVKNVFYRKKEKAKVDSPTILSLTSKGVIVRDISYNEGQVAESYYEYNPVEIGDLLLNPMDLVTNAFSSVSNVTGVISPAYFNLKNKEGINSRYFDYYFKLQYWNLSFFAHGKGVSFEHRWTMNTETLMNFIIPLPSESEQTAIANFLDDKTTKIDKLISNKQKLIEILKEERTAIIKMAVTRSINPNVKLKPSGIDWLGDIPEHWQVKKLKYVTKIFRGKFTHRPRNDERLYNGDHPFIQTGEISKAKKYLTEYTQTLNEEGYKVTTEFPQGTLLMTIAANIGEVAILGINACFPDSIVGFYPYNFIDNEFLFYKLKSMTYLFLSTSVVNTQMNLNVDRISFLPISFPRKEEQIAIVQHIETETKRIDSTASKIEEEIKLLQEYRTALISEVVTGKIKVI